MKKLRRLLFLSLMCLPLLLPTTTPAAAQQVDCRQTAIYDASTNGSTLLVAAGPQIFICGFTLVGAGTATVKLVSGTGVACATNEVALTPAYSLVAQTVVSDSSPFYRGLRVAAGLDLCIKTSAGVAIQAQIFYVQRN